jgi:hypothetical protein
VLPPSIESSGLIVLEIGVERYAYQVKATPVRAIFPMSSTERIQPGRTVTVSSRPDQQPFRPSRIVIGRNPDDWVVQDIRVGGLSQISPLGGIPGSAFSAHTVDALLLVTDAVGPVEITVSYVGNDPLGDAFVAAVMGESDLAGDPITLIGRRFVCRWTPEGKFEQWMAPSTAADLDVNAPG